jgi:hypothetical protein
MVDRPGAADPTHSHAPPKNAMVPDAATARLIAQAIWTAAYSTEVAAIDGALEVNINSGTWQIIGGPLFAVIQSLDGNIIAMGRVKEDANV